MYIWFSFYILFVVVFFGYGVFKVFGFSNRCFVKFLKYYVIIDYVFIEKCIGVL